MPLLAKTSSLGLAAPKILLLPLLEAGCDCDDDDEPRGLSCGK